jgi:hypothetical protein
MSGFHWTMRSDRHCQLSYPHSIFETVPHDPWALLLRESYRVAHIRANCIEYILHDSYRRRPIVR